MYRRYGKAGNKTLCDITGRIQKDFETKTNLAIFSRFKHISDLYAIHPDPYLLWKDASSPLIKACLNPKEVPAQYLRIVVADALGRPERTNWRQMDPELDKKLWSLTVKKLKPYFS